MLTLTLLALSAAANPLDLKDGDRVVWIGGTVAEREQKYGHWETALLLKFAERDITFRNLGWSGDTVWGDARAGFDTPAKGYERLVASVKAAKPTVLFVSYGANESFAGTDKLDAFEKQLEKLLAEIGGERPRIVLFTPTPVEESRNVKARNELLYEYSRIIRDCCDRRGYYLADLNRKLADHFKSGNRFTDNGVHFNDAGYESTIPDLLAVLGHSHEGFDPKQYEAVRKAVVRKNELVFHQWRPQNETYLFGFRKHEQGQNAKDIPAFDTLIADAEKDIRKLLK
jgi:lysophospholipase L1-like esterase